MSPVSCQLGLCSCHAQYSIVLSDEDGGDLVQEFKDEIDQMMGIVEVDYVPVPVYVTMGTIGNLHAEYLILFQYAGIPFILTTSCSIDGAGLSDAALTNGGGRLIASVYGTNNRRVYSLGFIEPSRNPLDYAKTYLERNPPIPSPDIDEAVAETHLVHSKTYERIGVISKDGGTRLEIYALDGDESRMIRGNKDFQRDPSGEREIPDGMVEVVAYGGLPDVISVGNLCSADGYVFEVWVPNAPGLTRMAREIYNDGLLPIDAFTVDMDGMEECYARFHGNLRKLEDEAIQKEIQSDSDMPPEIPTDEEI